MKLINLITTNAISKSNKYMMNTAPYSLDSNPRKVVTPNTIHQFRQYKVEIISKVTYDKLSTTTGVASVDDERRDASVKNALDLFGHCQTVPITVPAGNHLNTQRQTVRVESQRNLGSWHVKHVE